MDKINKELQSVKIPVTESEWAKLEEKLDHPLEIRIGKEKKPFDKWLAIAASLLLLVSAYLVFQWPGADELTLVESKGQELQYQQISPENRNILSHRTSINGQLPASKKSDMGLTPYLASLPNGEKWLIQLSISRETAECTAEIHTINDKPFPVNFIAWDDECLEFTSDRKTVSLQLMDKGENPVLLLVLNNSENEADDRLALELRPIYN